MVKMCSYLIGSEQFCKVCTVTETINANVDNAKYVNTTITMFVVKPVFQFYDFFILFFSPKPEPSSFVMIVPPLPPTHTPASL